MARSAKYQTLAWSAVLTIFSAGFPSVLLAEAAIAAAPAKKTVSLTFNYGDGVEKHFTRLPWKNGMTLLDAMKLADQFPHGIDFKHSGRGATAFVTEVDGVKNEGGGAKKRNWLFWVNGKQGDESFGVKELDAGDSALWKFDVYKAGE